MGWFAIGPPGPVTALYCYDDNDATGGHAAGSPHTWLELNTAYPVEFPRLQSAAGATYSATILQYLPAVLVTIGHPTAGNTNSTTFVDTSNSDIFVNGARLAFTAANSATTSFTMGTPIGTGERMVGKNGGSIHMSAAITFRGTVGLYGTSVSTVSSAIIFNNGTGLSMEVAGCQIQSGGGFQLGNSSGVAFRLYNTALISTATGNIITVSFVTEGAGNVFGCTNPNSFLSSGAANLILGDIVLSGAPAAADIRCTTTTPFWSLNNVRWSETPSIPRIVFITTGTPVLPNDGIADFRTFDTKVVDPNGNPLSGIPVYITSDVDGNIMDTVTLADGNVSVTWPSGVVGVLPVRDYYADASANLLVRDRVYLAEINGFSGSTAPTQGFGTKFITFEWPGRDRLGTGYSPDGGSFQKVLDVVQLDYGAPSHAVATSWIERTVP